MNEDLTKSSDKANAKDLQKAAESKHRFSKYLNVKGIRDCCDLEKKSSFLNEFLNLTDKESLRSNQPRIDGMNDIQALLSEDLTTKENIINTSRDIKGNGQKNKLVNGLNVQEKFINEMNFRLLDDSKAIDNKLNPVSFQKNTKNKISDVNPFKQTYNIHSETITDEFDSKYMNSIFERLNKIEFKENRLTLRENNQITKNNHINKVFSGVSRSELHNIENMNEEMGNKKFLKDSTTDKIINEDENNKNETDLLSMNDEDDKINLEYLIDPSNRTDNRTTCMIKNIPNNYSIDALEKIINQTHQGKYDFLYLRMDFDHRCNAGYAFINFKSPEDVYTFFDQIDGRKWIASQSKKIAKLTFARIQGLNNLIKRFKNSTIHEKDKLFRPKLFYTEGQQVGKQRPWEDLRK